MDNVTPRNHDPLLRVPSNSAMDSRGVAFGLQGNLYFPVVMSAVLSIAIFTLLLLNTAFPVPRALLVSALPFGATVMFILLFVNGKKPHYLSDLFASLTAGDFSRPFRQPKHPVSAALEKAAKQQPGSRP